MKRKLSHAFLIPVFLKFIFYWHAFYGYGYFLNANIFEEPSILRHYFGSMTPGIRQNPINLIWYITIFFNNFIPVHCLDSFYMNFDSSLITNRHFLLFHKNNICDVIGAK